MHKPLKPEGMAYLDLIAYYKAAQLINLIKMFNSKNNTGWLAFEREFVTPVFLSEVIFLSDQIV